MQAKWGNEYSYFACPRANIFRRDANNIGSLGDLQVRAGLRMTASGGDGRVRAWGSGSCGTTSGRRTRSRWGRPRGASPRATTWSRTPRTADAVRAAPRRAHAYSSCVCVSVLVCMCLARAQRTGVYSCPPPRRRRDRCQGDLRAPDGVAHVCDHRGTHHRQPARVYLGELAERASRGAARAVQLFVVPGVGAVVGGRARSPTRLGRTGAACAHPTAALCWAVAARRWALLSTPTLVMLRVRKHGLRVARRSTFGLRARVGETYSALLRRPLLKRAITRRDHVVVARCRAAPSRNHFCGRRGPEALDIL